MGAQHLGPFAFGAEFVHDAIPQQTRGAQLGGLHKEIHADGKEEGQAPCELVHVHPRLDRGAHVFLAVGKGIGQFLHQVRPGLLHVIARDRDRIEFRHLGAGVFNDVRNDPHRRFRRINIGVSDHEFLEDVVLNGPRQQRLIVALFLAGHNEIRKDRDHRAIHRHRHGNLVERDAIKQDFHILDGIDSHTGLADIAFDTGVVAVIAAVGGQIECDRNALLPGGKVATVKGVGFLGGGKACVLANGPGAACVHRGLDAAGEWRLARNAAHMGQVRGVVFGVERLDLNPFEGAPVQIIHRASAQFLFSDC